jgi:hypothetical protein
MSQSLFHWCVLLQSVPESLVNKGDRAVIVDDLPFTSFYQECGYAIEVFRDGETIDVVSVPESWVKVLPEVWGDEAKARNASTPLIVEAA